MLKSETFIKNLLKLDVEEKADAICVTWRGKSIDRDPGAFLNPILFNILEKSTGENKKVILDFKKIDYMNSSTIMSISKFIEKGKEDNNTIQVYYNGSRKWQELSFSALKIFQTKDNRISFLGTM